MMMQSYMHFNHNIYSFSALQSIALTWETNSLLEQGSRSR